MNDRSTLSFTIGIVILMIALVVLCVMSAISMEQYVEYEFKLSEVQDGLYGVYSSVVSTIPAQNYEIITLCCDGQLMTFKGGLRINYTDGDPYVVYHKYNRVNGDMLYVYVPFGTIEFQGTTSVR